jgi:hypothetical protein
MWDTLLNCWMKSMIKRHQVYYTRGGKRAVIHHVMSRGISYIDPQGYIILVNRDGSYLSKACPHPDDLILEEKFDDVP